MTLQEMTQIVGGIGVISSLIYVAIQIRNNARAVRASAYQQLSATTAGQWEELARNSELCGLVLRGCDDFSSLDRIEKARFRFMLMAYMRRYENAWFQHKIGALKEDDWQAIACDMESMYSLPGPRIAWPLIKNRSNPSFRAHVDAMAQRLAAVAANGETLQAATPKA